MKSLRFQPLRAMQLRGRSHARRCGGSQPPVRRAGGHAAKPRRSPRTPSAGRVRCCREQKARRCCTHLLIEAFWFTRIQLRSK